MPEEQPQNDQKSPVIEIIGAILPIIFLLLFIYQMIESFFQS